MSMVQIHNQLVKGRRCPVVNKLDVNLFDEDLHGVETAGEYMFFNLNIHFSAPVNLIILNADYFF